LTGDSIMIRILRACILLIGVSSAAALGTEGSSTTAASAQKPPRRVHLTLSPARRAEPALAQLLLPDVLDQLPGNAAPGLYTAALSANISLSDAQRSE